MGKEYVKARLYLHAVLPLLEEVTKRDKQARDIVKKLSGVVQFSAPGGLYAQVEFKNGEVFVYPGREKRPSVILFLPTHKMLNNMFGGKGFALPIPIKGIFRMGLIKGFTKLADRLSFHMAPQTKPPIGDEKTLITSLLFYAATFGAVIVGDCDETAVDIVKKIPAGTALIDIARGPSVVITKTKDAFTVKKGAAESYTAHLGFRNTDLAYDMFTGKLDFMAAIPLGDATLAGSLAMVDQFAQLMEKAGGYLA